MTSLVYRLPNTKYSNTSISTTSVYFSASDKDHIVLECGPYGASAPPDPPISRPGGLPNIGFAFDFQYKSIILEASRPTHWGSGEADAPQELS